MATLQGKVALITGAGQGVGQGIALAMASEGANLALFGRTESKLRETAAMLAERGSEVAITCGDVKSKADLTKAVSEASQHLGGIDILVNNAQQVPLGHMQNVTDEDFVAGWESGPLAAFRLMNLVQPIMKERGGGCDFQHGFVCRYSMGYGRIWPVRSNKTGHSAFNSGRGIRMGWGQYTGLEHCAAR